MIAFMRSILIFSLLAALFSTAAVAQSAEADIKVYGNCNMCKKRIETALYVRGVKSAKWDSKTQLAHVVYKPSQVSVENLYNNLTHAGHDVEKLKAGDAIYNSLPACCHYREPAAAGTEHK